MAKITIKDSIHICSVCQKCSVLYLRNDRQPWCGGTIAWPPRSPDLTPLNFYFWGYMKQKVYAVVIESREPLLERNDIAAEEIRQNNLEIQRTTQSISFRAQTCLQSGGEHF
ncbi:hypothetical protein QTP88_015780 [Uroleucon formosanum]